MSDYRDFYRNRAVMITGGLGFIGSNLARRLADLGADVLLIDSLIPDYGGNVFNISGLEGSVRVNVADIRQAATMNYLVRDREIVFNLAGQVSHIDRADMMLGLNRLLFMAPMYGLLLPTRLNANLEVKTKRGFRQ